MSDIGTYAHARPGYPICTLQCEGVSGGLKTSFVDAIGDVDRAYPINGL